MKTAILLSTTLAFMTGFMAAWKWLKASRIEIDLGWLPTWPEPVIRELAHMDQIVANTSSIEEIRRATNVSNRLNGIAALWTGASVAWSALANILSIISP